MSKDKLKQKWNKKLHLEKEKEYINFGRNFKFDNSSIRERIKYHGLGGCEYWDVSEVTDMKKLFESQRTFNKDISMWNTSNVTDVRGMFEYCENFNQDISSWNVSNVTNMSSMFYCCENFNQDIGNWNVSNVTNMLCMFYMCSKFNQNISKWNINNVKNMRSMFYMCTNFNQNINTWKVDRFKVDVYRMFSGCNEFWKIYIRKWNIDKSTRKAMFRYDD